MRRLGSARVTCRGGAGSDVRVWGACAAQCWGEAGTTKMATSNSLDEVLSTDVDPSAVTAIVGSLQTQFAASAKTAANQPVNGSENGGVTNKTAVFGEGITNCSNIGVKGPAVSSSAVLTGKVVCGVGGVGQAQQAPGGPAVVQASRGGNATQQERREAALTCVRGAAGVKPVYGAAPTPMTGAQGTQVVNGGVSGAGTGAAPQGSLHTQLALKGLTKVVTAAGSVGQTAVIMSKPGTVTAVPSTVTPGTVPLPQGMQIINMRPGQALKTSQGTTIAPRMILNQAQVLPAGIRAGQPGVGLHSLSVVYFISLLASYPKPCMVHIYILYIQVGM